MGYQIAPVDASTSNASTGFTATRSDYRGWFSLSPIPPQFVCISLNAQSDVETRVVCELGLQPSFVRRVKIGVIVGITVFHCLLWLLACNAPVGEPARGATSAVMLGLIMVWCALNFWLIGKFLIPYAFVDNVLSRCAVALGCKSEAHELGSAFPLFFTLCHALILQLPVLFLPLVYMRLIAYSFLWFAALAGILGSLLMRWLQPQPKHPSRYLGLPPNLAFAVCSILYLFIPLWLAPLSLSVLGLFFIANPSPALAPLPVAATSLFFFGGWFVAATLPFRALVEMATVFAKVTASARQNPSMFLVADPNRDRMIRTVGLLTFPLLALFQFSGVLICIGSVLTLLLPSGTIVGVFPLVGIFVFVLEGIFSYWLHLIGMKEYAIHFVRFFVLLHAVPALCIIGWVVQRTGTLPGGSAAIGSDGIHRFSQHPQLGAVRETLLRICDYFGIAQPIIVLKDSPLIEAFVEIPRTPNLKARIVISQGAIEKLPQGQLEALLAHEVGHIVHGHVRQYAWLFFLSRWALLGECFLSFLMDHSEVLENAADRTAVEWLERVAAAPAGRENLIQALKAMNAQRIELELHFAKPAIEGIGAISRDWAPNELLAGVIPKESVPVRQRVRLLVRVADAYLFRGWKAGYIYLPVEARIAAIREIKLNWSHE